MNYNHKKIEKKWQNKWYKENYFKTNLDSKKEKYYSLDMFPYPSGAGLHVGHPKGYTATDIIARYKRMQGFEVLHPIGWDAFGLPAEQHALRTGKNPSITTKENINNFRKQLKMLGISYDFTKEVNTTDPNYYKTTQWIFSKLYEKGLAEKKSETVNWCENLGTVLANEEVILKDGQMVSEVGGFPVVKKPMEQWVLKITEYSDKLLEGLDNLEWPKSVKKMQKEWIGKSKGFNVTFKGDKHDILVFTNRIDLLDKVSFIYIAPENKNTLELATDNNIKKVKSLIEKTKKINLIERQKSSKLSDNVFTGNYVLNPITGKRIPVFVSLQVLPNFGEESLIGIVKENNISEQIYLENKKIINSKIYKVDELIKDESKEIKNIKNDLIVEKTNYKLKDWLFSRQRYWGEPFPILYDEKGNISLDTNLPLKLPKVSDYHPKGEFPPLINASKNWRIPTINGVSYTRELNTMPQWAGSCWYYIAYLLKEGDSYLELNSKKAKDRINKWLPVDLYIGGQEHAVLHLMYARFWNLFLYDIGILDKKEPFKKLINQGMILGTDGEKMSKSRGNVINPDDIIEEYGADSLRLYEMFMGSIVDSRSWSNNDLAGMKKWLDRVWRLFDIKKLKIDSKNNKELDSDYNLFIKNVTNNLNEQKFNMVISDMMVFINSCYKVEKLYSKYMIGFLQVLSLFAPHISAEIYEMFDTNKKLDNLKWPVFDEQKIKGRKEKLVIQVNGKVKELFEIDKKLTEKEAVNLAIDSKKILNIIKDKKNIKKVIFIKNKVLNIII